MVSCWPKYSKSCINFNCRHCNFHMKDWYSRNPPMNSRWGCIGDILDLWSHWSLNFWYIHNIQSFERTSCVGAHYWRNVGSRAHPGDSLFPIISPHLTHNRISVDPTSVFFVLSVCLSDVCLKKAKVWFVLIFDPNLAHFHFPCFYPCLDREEEESKQSASNFLNSMFSKVSYNNIRWSSSFPYIQLWSNYTLKKKYEKRRRFCQSLIYRMLNLVGKALNSKTSKAVWSETGSRGCQLFILTLHSQPKLLYTYNNDNIQDLRLYSLGKLCSEQSNSRSLSKKYASFIIFQGVL